MLTKMPWLVSRRRLLILSIIDYLIIIINFYILQTSNFINTNFIAINILALFWILISYALDKYSIIEDDSDIDLLNKLIRSIKTCILCGICFKFIIIIFSSLNSDVGDGKWPYLIFSIAIASLLYELIHSSIIKYNFSKPINWISIYSNFKDGSLIKKPKNLEKFGYIRALHKSEISTLIELENNKFGFILEDINMLSNSEKQILINLKNKGFKILSLINWLERYLHRYPSEFISSSCILEELLILKVSKTALRIKRISEFSLSIFLLFILSPIILIAAFLIKLEDNGPIIYTQKRSGFGGRIFTIYKLRSMRTNAEKDGIKWSSENDQRVTKVGYWLRKTRIDELPQLFSVLKGDMSLIGPRPERPELDKMLSKKIPNYKLRYLLRPGLSGWAQVNYPYGASVADTKMKFSYDIYYIKNLSTFFDFLILLETIRLVFNFRGSQPKIK